MVFKNINFTYNNEPLFENFEIDIEDEKVNCIMGESGVGKTTLINIIKDNLLERDIDLSYIFQEYSLIPWQNVYNNIDIAVKGKIKDKNIREKRINNILKKVGLENYKEYYPEALSGGMKQRVNIARAMCYDANFIIMDEPFKALDETTKGNIMTWMKEEFKAKDKTVIFVTHNINECNILSDSKFVLNGNPLRVQKM